MQPKFIASMLAAGLLMPGATPAAVWGQVAADPRVDSLFSQWNGDATPGCALAVYRNGATVYARGYGMADLERRVPITPHSVFDIGSTSKQFTAASIILLAQQGKLSLDDDIRRHIPELPSYSRPITIRQLIHHTSGIRDYIGLLTLAGHDYDDVTTVKEALDIIARQRALNFEPGTQYLYSNSGYFLLSVVVERVSGIPLSAFAREHIFQPLGMTRTHYMGSYDDVVPDRALAYETRKDGTLRMDVPRWQQTGDGAVLTTVEDLAHWDANFYRPVVGGQPMLDQLHARGRLHDSTTIDYAAGLFVTEYRGLRRVSHGGSWGGYNAELLRFPDQHFSAALLCNDADANPVELALRVAEIHLADVMTDETAAPAATQKTVFGTPAATLSRPQQQRYVGLWRTAEWPTALEIVAERDTLFMVVPNGTRYPLRPRTPMLLDVLNGPTGATMKLLAVSRGTPDSLSLYAGPDNDLFFEKIITRAITPVEMEAYRGVYYSDELDAAITIGLAEGKLEMRPRSGDAEVLRPMEQDEFAAGADKLRFIRDAAGTLTGFALDTGRARDLRFVRRE